MLVRARVKAIEQLPDWAKCCDDILRQFARDKGIVVSVDLTNTRSSATKCCRFCQADFPKVSGAWCPEWQQYIELELFDLDEGPLEAA